MDSQAQDQFKPETAIDIDGNADDDLFESSIELARRALPSCHFMSTSMPRLYPPYEPLLNGEDSIETIATIAEAEENGENYELDHRGKAERIAGYVTKAILYGWLWASAVFLIYKLLEHFFLHLGN